MVPRRRALAALGGLVLAAVSGGVAEAKPRRPRRSSVAGSAAVSVAVTPGAVVYLPAPAGGRFVKARVTVTARKRLDNPAFIKFDAEGRPEGTDGSLYVPDPASSYTPEGNPLPVTARMECLLDFGLSPSRRAVLRSRGVEGTVTVEWV